MSRVPQSYGDKCRPGAAILISVLVSGCAGLLPSYVPHVEVTSEPSGAEVFVMGERMGTTPLRLESSTLFPHTYPPEKQPLYGRIRLTHPGCEAMERSVDTRTLENGLQARLKCAAAPSAPPPPAAQRLRELEILRQEGLLSEEEYKRVRARIIDAL